MSQLVFSQNAFCEFPSINSSLLLKVDQRSSFDKGETANAITFELKSDSRYEIFRLMYERGLSMHTTKIYASA